MTWSNLIQHVDKHKLPWAKRSTQHIENENTNYTNTQRKGKHKDLL